MIRSYAAAFALALACTIPANAGQSTDVSVSGTGSVTLAPTLATVNAEVSTNAPTASEAVSQNNTTYNRVVAALEHTGVPRSDVALSYYNVNYNPPPKVRPPNPGNQQYGYTVTRGFSVKEHDIGKAGSVVDACTSAGATSINGVSFGLADESAARAQAIGKAVDNARVNATALARAAHLRIAGIKSIEYGAAGPIVPFAARVMATANAPTQFDQGNVTVTATVTVTFAAVAE
jgi:uncharacterized protein YggE